MATAVRSSRPEAFCNKGVLRNFEKFTGKYLCQSLFFNKVAGLRQKKRLWHRCFPVNFPKFLRTPILTEHPWWLLLCSMQKKTSQTTSSKKVRNRKWWNVCNQEWPLDDFKQQLRIVQIIRSL